MASIKEFIKKKRLEARFKKLGPGHRLTDETSPASNAPPTSAPSSSQPRPPAPPSAHLDAALARLNTQKSKNVDWSAIHLKAQVKKELEREKATSGQADPSQGGDGRKDGPSTKSRKKSGNPPMVQGVYFNCDLLGPETGTYEKIVDNIMEYLHLQMAEEPVLASILLIHSCNEMSRVRTGVATLTRYLTNIIEHPTEEKYRKIRLQNKVFQERVASLTGALEFLEAVGFVKMEMSNPDGGEEPYMVFLTEDDPGTLRDIIESLSSADPILPRLDRNMQVLAPAVAATQLDLPDDFFNLTLDEIRREQALKKRRVELLTQMRTSAQRDQDEVDEPVRQYGYTVIRVKLPDDIILQGTFSAFERVEDVEQFVRDCLADSSLKFVLRGPAGEKLESPLVLESLRLVPAAVLYLQPETSPTGGGVSLLTEEAMALLQNLLPQR